MRRRNLLAGSTESSATSAALVIATSTGILAIPHEQLAADSAEAPVSTWAASAAPRNDRKGAPAAPSAKAAAAGARAASVRRRRDVDAREDVARGHRDEASRRAARREDRALQKRARDEQRARRDHRGRHGRAT